MERKTYIHSFAWLGILFVVLGAITSGSVTIIQFMDINSAELNVLLGGLNEPASEETVTIVKWMLLLSLGPIGAVLMLFGLAFVVVLAAKRGQNKRLCENGERISAQAIGVRYVGGGRCRLLCEHTDALGTLHEFLSVTLCANPMENLPGGRVFVFCDASNMRRYFVDVDGSAGLGRDS